MGVKKIKIAHIRNKCIGCGMCECLAEHSWKMNDDDGQSDLVGGKEQKNGMVTGEITEDEYIANKKAAEACPVRIIKLD